MQVAAKNADRIVCKLICFADHLESLDDRDRLKNTVLAIKVGLSVPVGNVSLIRRMFSLYSKFKLLVKWISEISRL